VIALGVAERISASFTLRGRTSATGHGIAAGLTCLLIPAAAVFLGAASGAIYIRYALPFVVGCDWWLLAAWWVRRESGRRRADRDRVAVTVAQVGVRGIVQAHIAVSASANQIPARVSLEGLGRSC